jgi:hypothetical protein
MDGVEGVTHDCSWEAETPAAVYVEADDKNCPQGM